VNAGITSAVSNDTSGSTVHAGLDGIVAAATRLSSVDGLAGELVIAGYRLEEIAPHATFEEMVYLLWHDRLPNADELAVFQACLTAARALPEATLQLLRTTAPRVPAMDALRMAAATLSLDSDNSTRAGIEPDAIALVARFPTIVAAWHRLARGEEPIAPDPGLGLAANLLWMLSGQYPDAEQVRALDTYLNTVIDHGLNASTFAARVIIATDSDLVSAITGALGALKGPLHGGAPGPALDMVFEIGDSSRSEAYLRAKLERGERLMGFGHRIYKVRDPRADVLAEAAIRLFGTGSADQGLFTLARQVEADALRLLEEYKPGRNLQTNVEFYTALLLHGLGLDTAVFTPTFAVSRVAGWIAHCFEQRSVGRIIRPQSIYSGETDRRWTPVGER
jgi:citrate synthase